MTDLVRVKEWVCRMWNLESARSLVAEERGREIPETRPLSLSFLCHQVCRRLFSLTLGLLSTFTRSTPSASSSLSSCPFECGSAVPIIFIGIECHHFHSTLLSGLTLLCPWPPLLKRGCFISSRWRLDQSLHWLLMSQRCCFFGLQFYPSYSAMLCCGMQRYVAECCVFFWQSSVDQLLMFHFVFKLTRRLALSSWLTLMSPVLCLNLQCGRIVCFLLLVVSHLQVVAQDSDFISYSKI